MSKINVLVTLKNEDNISKEEYIALKNNNKIIYEEKEYKTTIFLDGFKIVRKSKDYLIEMDFIPNKTTKGFYLVGDKQIDLEILTDYLIIKDNLILLKYKVLTTEQDVIFRLECVNK